MNKNSIIVKDKKTYDVLKFVIDKAYSMGFKDAQSKIPYFNFPEDVQKDIEKEVKKEFGIIFKPNK